MDKSNLELFKQALSEGLSNKFDSVANSCTEEIVRSEKHNIAMRTIVYGKTERKRILSPGMRKVIAILVAIALLLTSCGLIFGNRIREMVEDFFVKLTYSGDEINGETIEEVYGLSYLPDGYYLEEETITPLLVHYKFKNDSNDSIWFEQRILDGSDYFIDSESGYSKIVEIEEYEVYYRFTDNNYHYVWNDGKCAMKLKSNTKLSNEEIVLILNGASTK